MPMRPLIVALVLLGALAGAEARSLSQFTETLPGDQAAVVNRLLAGEIAESRANASGDGAVPPRVMGWAAPIGAGREAIFVQILGRYWCGSGGCNTWILVRDGAGWRRAVDRPFLAQEIAVDPGRGEGPATIVTWETRSSCAALAWNGRTFREGSFGNHAFCRR
jgi:hypothetical protein